MALNIYATLLPYYISITPAESSWGIAVSAKPGFENQPRYLFGEINQVNDSIYSVSVGNHVFFDANQAVLVTEGNDLYYLTQLDSLIFKERIPT